MERNTFLYFIKKSNLKINLLLDKSQFDGV